MEDYLSRQLVESKMAAVRFRRLKASINRSMVTGVMELKKVCGCPSGRCEKCADLWRLLKGVEIATRD